MKVYTNGEKYEEALVEIVVEHKNFYVPLHKLMMFPESYFCVALKPHWRCNNESSNEQAYQLIVTDRSASLFRLIAMYLEFGEVPRDKQGECLFDSRLLELLREEADYYCLSPLMLELDKLLKIKTNTITEARKYMCDELQLTEGCVIGHDRRWFESEDMKYREFYYSMRAQCDEGIVDACSFDFTCTDYHIIVDSINQSHTGIFDYSDSEDEDNFDDVNFLHCFKKLEDHYGTAKLEVADKYHTVLTSTCVKLLSLTPRKFNLKLIQLQYISHEGTWTIDDAEGVSESEAAIGYVIVQRKSKDCRGGRLLLNREDWEGYKSVICFIGVDRYEITRVTSGDQRVLVFAIVPGTSKFPERSFVRYWSISYLTRMSKEASYFHLLKSIFEHVQNRFIVGLYAEHYYSDTHEGYKAFSPDTLLGNDKLLFQFAQANNIPISLVFVRGYEDGSVRILDSLSHTLHDYHKNIGNIQFIPLFRYPIYRLDRKEYSLKSIFDTKCHPFIAAAFVVKLPSVSEANIF